MQQLQAAVQAYQGGNLNGAELVFKQILEVNSKEPNALHLLGCIHKDRGELQKAIDLIQASIREEDSNPIPFLNLGKILAIAGQHENAAGVFQESLKRNQQIPETWFCFGNSLNEIEKTEEAIQAYLQVLKLDSSRQDARQQLEQLLFQESKWSELRLLLEERLGKQPDNFAIRANYGSVLLNLGESMLAIQQLRAAAKISSGNDAILFNLANALRDEGEIEEAIVSYRKAIELKPDFADAYFALGSVLKEEGEIEEARQIISALYRMKPLEKESIIAFQDKTLVFDWHHRRALGLSCEIELNASFLGKNSSSILAAVKQADALCFPPLFLGEEAHFGESKQLYEKGYLVEDDLLSADLCTQLIGQLDAATPMSIDLIQSVSGNGILRSILEKIKQHTRFPHLIWNCIYFAKGPDDEAVSDAWHYDNHYNIWTPKLMVYLNNQREEGGATEFIDATLSRMISEETDYMGLVWQRESYADRMKGLAKDLNLDPVTLDPEHYTFSPDHAGSGVWFCPSRALHRGVSPKIGVRHVLSFSLTPLPEDCGWSIDQCVEKTIEILKDKINKGKQESDINPYWIPAAFL